MAKVKENNQKMSKKNVVLDSVFWGSASSDFSGIVVFLLMWGLVEIRLNPYPSDEVKLPPGINGMF